MMARINCRSISVQRKDDVMHFLSVCLWRWWCMWGRLVEEGRDGVSETWRWRGCCVCVCVCVCVFVCLFLCVCLCVCVHISTVCLLVLWICVVSPCLVCK